MASFCVSSIYGQKVCVKITVLGVMVANDQTVGGPNSAPTQSLLLFPWARHFTHISLYECWVVAVWCRLVATLPSVCPWAAVATYVAYHHLCECGVN